MESDGLEECLQRKQQEYYHIGRVDEISQAWAGLARGALTGSGSDKSTV